LFYFPHSSNNFTTSNKIINSRLLKVTHSTFLRLSNASCHTNWDFQRLHRIKKSLLSTTISSFRMAFTNSQVVGRYSQTVQPYSQAIGRYGQMTQPNSQVVGRYSQTVRPRGQAVGRYGQMTQPRS